MSVVDFLFEGSAPTPGTSSTTSQIQLPKWYTDYTTDMLGRAQAAANLPYAQYTGPRIAGFTPTEQTGFDMFKQAATSYQPFLNQSADYLGQAGLAAQQLGGFGGGSYASAAQAAQPYFGQAAGKSAAAAAQPMLGQAAGMSALRTAQPYLTQALSPIQEAGRGSALTATQPYLGAASQMFPEQFERYMNPYIENVVKQIADVGVEQLQEKYLPAVGQEFIGAGQFSVGPGSTRMGEFGARALRDVQKSVLGEQAKALQAGYGQAADIFASDAARQSQLAQLVGSLSTQDLNRLMESGVQTANIGSMLGRLSGEDAERLARIASTTGELTSADAQLLASLGRSTGELTGMDSRLAAEMDRFRGEMALSGQRALADLASRYADLGGTAQAYGFKGAEAISGVGAKERAMRQANLDLAYQDFLNQQKYPQDQVKFLADMLKGINLPQTTVQTRTDTPAMQGDPSLIAKLITGGKGVDEFLDMIRKYFPKSELHSGTTT